MQNEGRIILRIEDLFSCRLYLRILRQNARTQNLICEDFEDGVGWCDPHRYLPTYNHKCISVDVCLKPMKICSGLCTKKIL